MCMCVHLMSVCVCALGHTSAWRFENSGHTRKMSLDIISLRLGKGSSAFSDFPGLRTNSALDSLHSHLQCTSICVCVYIWHMFLMFLASRNSAFPWWLVEYMWHMLNK